MERDLEELEERLGYIFREGRHLHDALTHRSYLSDHPEALSNERLEFLGDAVLQLAVTHFLFDRFPDLPEGDMAKVRAAVVNASTLATLADALGLGSRLLLGRGEEITGGRSKDSILADAMEAVLGAVYLDAGFEEARRVVLALLEDEIVERAARPGQRDYKTRLQEVLAKDGKQPVYQVLGEGPDHRRSFTATVSVEGDVLGAGTGRSKKQAEQRAAQEGLRRLDGGDRA